MTQPEMTPEQRIEFLKARFEEFAKLPSFIFGQRVEVVGGFYQGQKGFVDTPALTFMEDKLPDGTILPEQVISYKVVFKGPLGLTTREVQAQHLAAFEGEIDFSE